MDIDNEEHVRRVKQSLKKENRNLNQLKNDLETDLGLVISKVSLRRFLTGVSIRVVCGTATATYRYRYLPLFKKVNFVNTATAILK